MPGVQQPFSHCLRADSRPNITEAERNRHGACSTSRSLALSEAKKPRTLGGMLCGRNILFRRWDHGKKMITLRVGLLTGWRIWWIAGVWCLACLGNICGTLTASLPVTLVLNDVINYSNIFIYLFIYFFLSFIYANGWSSPCCNSYTLQIQDHAMQS